MPYGKSNQALKHYIWTAQIRIYFLQINLQCNLCDFFEDSNKHSRSSSKWQTKSHFIWTESSWAFYTSNANRFNTKTITGKFSSELRLGHFNWFLLITVFTPFLRSDVDIWILFPYFDFCTCFFLLCVSKVDDSKITVNFLWMQTFFVRSSENGALHSNFTSEFTRSSWWNRLKRCGWNWLAARSIEMNSVKMFVVACELSLCCRHSLFLPNFDS